MKKMLLLVTASLYLSCSLLAQEEAKKIDSLLLKSVNNAEFSGTVLVAKAGKIVLHKGYGYSHEEQKTPRQRQNGAGFQNGLMLNAKGRTPEAELFDSLIVPVLAIAHQN